MTSGTFTAASAEAYPNTYYNASGANASYDSNLDGYGLFKIPVTIEAGAIGEYTVEVKFDYISYTDYTDYTLASDTVTSTITISEPAAPAAPYEIYYELDKSDNVDNDSYMNYLPTDEVTAEIFVVNNNDATEGLMLQAYDIFLTHNTNLKYESTTMSATNVVAADGALTRIQMVGENSQPVAIAQGQAVSLGAVTFTIDAAAVHNTPMDITLTCGDSGTVLSVGTEIAQEGGDIVAYYPKDTTAVKGAEVYQTYTITYADGVADEEITVPADGTKGHNETYNVSSEKPSRTGYNFTGWLGNDGETYAAGTSYTGNTNLILTAQWQKNTFKVEWFDADGNVIETDTDVAHGATAVFNGTTPTKIVEGYTVKFLGWNTDKAATEALLAESMKVTADTKFYPIFSQTANEYTIAFENTGDTVINAMTQPFGTSITKPADPTKTGYTFAGWTPAIPDTMPATENETKTLTITANWTPVEYTITLVPGEATVDWTSKTYTIESTGISLPTPTPTDTDYVFAGWKVTTAGGSWNDGAVYPAGAVSNMHGDVTLTAEWALNVFKINYDLGEVGTISDLPLVHENGTETTIDNPVVPGYTFNGWTSEVLGITNAKDVVIAADKTIDSEIDLKASFTINQYTITFADTGDMEIAPITQNYNTEITVPANPTKTGYTFAGWDKTIPEKMPAEDMTITANWTINQYTITFDTDGGSAVDAIKQEYGTAITDPADPTKTGYTFKGWSETIPTTMPAADMTITAQWEINKYTITFDIGAGESNPKIEQDYGTAITDPVDPTKNGYTFTGWDKTIPTTMPAEDVTITAKWMRNDYTLIFDPNGGTLVEGESTQTINIDTAITLPVPTKDNSTFKGWKVESVDGEGNWNVDSVHSGSTIDAGKYGSALLIAVWEDAVTYVVEDYKYAYTGYKLLIVAADALEATQEYTFNGSSMYYTADTNYLPENATGAFYTLIEESYVNSSNKLTDEGLKALQKATVTERATIAYDGEINGDSKLNIADANIVYQMVVRGGAYYSEDQLNIASRLAADMVTSKTESEHRGSIADVNEIVNKINSNTN